VNAPTIQPFDTFKSRQFIYQSQISPVVSKTLRAITVKSSAHATEPIPGLGYVNYVVHARRYGRVLFEFQSAPG
jgi:hypothetical protein